MDVPSQVIIFVDVWHQFAKQTPKTNPVFLQLKQRYEHDKKKIK